MRTRDEVVIGSYRYTLRENGWTVTHVDHENTTPVTWPHTVEMIDRIRELEALVDKLTEKNLNLSIECDGLEDELRHPTTPTRGSDE